MFAGNKSDDVIYGKLIEKIIEGGPVRPENLTLAAVRAALSKYEHEDWFSQRVSYVDQAGSVALIFRSGYILRYFETQAVSAADRADVPQPTRTVSSRRLNGALSKELLRVNAAQARDGSAPEGAAVESYKMETAALTSFFSVPVLITAYAINVSVFTSAWTVAYVITMGLMPVLTKIYIERALSFRDVEKYLKESGLFRAHPLVARIHRFFGPKNDYGLIGPFAAARSIRELWDHDKDSIGKVSYYSYTMEELYIYKEAMRRVPKPFQWVIWLHETLHGVFRVKTEIVAVPLTYCIPWIAASVAAGCLWFVLPYGSVRFLTTFTGYNLLIPALMKLVALHVGLKKSPAGHYLISGEIWKELSMEEIEYRISRHVQKVTRDPATGRMEYWRDWLKGSPAEPDCELVQCPGRPEDIIVIRGSYARAGAGAQVAGPFTGRPVSGRAAIESAARRSGKRSLRVVIAVDHPDAAELGHYRDMIIDISADIKSAIRSSGTGAIFRADLVSTRYDLTRLRDLVRVYRGRLAGIERGHYDKDAAVACEVHGNVAKLERLLGWLRKEDYKRLQLMGDYLGKSAKEVYGLEAIDVLQEESQRPGGLDINMLVGKSEYLMLLAMMGDKRMRKIWPTMRGFEGPKVMESLKAFSRLDPTPDMTDEKRELVEASREFADLLEARAIRKDGRLTDEGLAAQWNEWYFLHPKLQAAADFMVKGMRFVYNEDIDHTVYIIGDRLSDTFERHGLRGLEALRDMEGEFRESSRSGLRILKFMSRIWFTANRAEEGPVSKATLSAIRKGIIALIDEERERNLNLGIEVIPEKVLMEMESAAISGLRGGDLEGMLKLLADTLREAAGPMAAVYGEVFRSGDTPFDVPDTGDKAPPKESYGVKQDRRMRFGINAIVNLGLFTSGVQSLGQVMVRDRSGEFVLRDVDSLDDETAVPEKVLIASRWDFDSFRSMEAEKLKSIDGVLERYDPLNEVLEGSLYGRLVRELRRILRTPMPYSRPGVSAPEEDFFDEEPVRIEEKRPVPSNRSGLAGGIAFYDELLKRSGISRPLTDLVKRTKVYLDAGCGVGLSAVEAAAGNPDIVALGLDKVEIRDERLRAASDEPGQWLSFVETRNRMVSEGRYAFMRSDLAEAELPLRPGLITSIFVFQELDDPLAAFANLYNQLEAGGTMIFTVVNPKGRGAGYIEYIEKELAGRHLAEVSSAPLGWLKSDDAEVTIVKVKKTDDAVFSPSLRLKGAATMDVSIGGTKVGIKVAEYEKESDKLDEAPSGRKVAEQSAGLLGIALDDRPDIGPLTEALEEKLAALVAMAENVESETELSEWELTLIDIRWAEAVALAAFVNDEWASLGFDRYLDVDEDGRAIRVIFRDGESEIYSARQKMFWRGKKDGGEAAISARQRAFIEKGKVVEILQDGSVVRVRRNRSNPRSPPVERRFRADGIIEKIELAKDPELLRRIAESGAYFTLLNAEERRRLVREASGITLTVIMGVGYINKREMSDGNELASVLHLRSGFSAEYHGLKPTFWIGEKLLYNSRPEELALFLLEECQHLVRRMKPVGGRWHGLHYKEGVPGSPLYDDDTTRTVLHSQDLLAIMRARRIGLTGPYDAPRVRMAPNRPANFSEIRGHPEPPARGRLAGLREKPGEQSAGAEGAKKRVRSLSVYTHEESIWRDYLETLFGCNLKLFVALAKRMKAKASGNGPALDEARQDVHELTVRAQLKMTVFGQRMKELPPGTLALGVHAQIKSKFDEAVSLIEKGNEPAACASLVGAVNLISGAREDLIRRRMLRSKPRVRVVKYDDGLILMRQQAYVKTDDRAITLTPSYVKRLFKLRWQAGRSLDEQEDSNLRERTFMSGLIASVDGEIARARMAPETVALEEIDRIGLALAGKDVEEKRLAAIAIGTVRELIEMGSASSVKHLLPVARRYMELRVEAIDSILDHIMKGRVNPLHRIVAEEKSDLLSRVGVIERLLGRRDYAGALGPTYGLWQTVKWYLTDKENIKEPPEPDLEGIDVPIWAFISELEKAKAFTGASGGYDDGKAQFWFGVLKNKIEDSQHLSAFIARFRDAYVKAAKTRAPGRDLKADIFISEFEKFVKERRLILGSPRLKSFRMLCYLAAFVRMEDPAFKPINTLRLIVEIDDIDKIIRSRKLGGLAHTLAFLRPIVAGRHEAGDPSIRTIGELCGNGHADERKGLVRALAEDFGLDDAGRFELAKSFAITAENIKKDYTAVAQAAVVVKPAEQSAKDRVVESLSPDGEASHGHRVVGSLGQNDTHNAQRITHNGTSLDSNMKPDEQSAKDGQFAGLVTNAVRIKEPYDFKNAKWLRKGDAAIPVMVCEDHDAMVGWLKALQAAGAASKDTTIINFDTHADSIDDWGALNIGSWVRWIRQHRISTGRRVWVKSGKEAPYDRAKLNPKDIRYAYGKDIYTSIGEMARSVSGPAVITIDYDYIAPKYGAAMTQAEMRREVNGIVDALINSGIKPVAVNFTFSKDYLGYPYTDDLLFHGGTDIIISKAFIGSFGRAGYKFMGDPDEAGEDEDDEDWPDEDEPEKPAEQSAGTQQTMDDGSADIMKADEAAIRGTALWNDIQREREDEEKRALGLDTSRDDPVRLAGLNQLFKSYLKGGAMNDGTRIMLSESLFRKGPDGKDDSELIQARIALAPLLTSGAVAIMKPGDIRRESINRGISKDKVAAVFTKEDFENSKIWNGSDRETSLRASVLIIDGKLTGNAYLYLEGVIGLARAIMAGNALAIQAYYRLISGSIVDEAVLGSLRAEDQNNVAFALKAILRFKPIDMPVDSRDFENARLAMENTLIAA
jgi:SAM-dependent methyltransferase